MRQKQKKIVWRHTPFSDVFLFDGYSPFSAPRQPNTQHNRYVPFPADPMGGLAKPYVAKEKAIMIHLQPPASEGVTEPEL